MCQSISKINLFFSHCRLAVHTYNWPDEIALSSCHLFAPLTKLVGLAAELTCIISLSINIKDSSLYADSAAKVN